jgi:hypothetical protein
LKTRGELSLIRKILIFSVTINMNYCSSRSIGLSSAVFLLKTVTNISVHVSERFMPRPQDGLQWRYEPYLSPDMSLMKDDE